VPLAQQLAVGVAIRQLHQVPAFQQLCGSEAAAPAQGRCNRRRITLQRFQRAEVCLDQRTEHGMMGTQGLFAHHQHIDDLAGNVAAGKYRLRTGSEQAAAGRIEGNDGIYLAIAKGLLMFLQRHMDDGEIAGGQAAVLQQAGQHVGAEGVGFDAEAPAAQVLWRVDAGAGQYHVGTVGEGENQYDTQRVAAFRQVQCFVQGYRGGIDGVVAEGAQHIFGVVEVHQLERLIVEQAQVACMVQAQVAWPRIAADAQGRCRTARQGGQAEQAGSQEDGKRTRHVFAVFNKRFTHRYSIWLWGTIKAIYPRFEYTYIRRRIERGSVTPMFQFSAPPPLGLYVHVPWCVRKCPYCDFNSHEMKGDIPEVAYVDALLADLEQDLPAVWGRPVSSVFIGGGTPSLLSPEALERLFSGLRARLRLLPEAEITLEANPGTVEAGRFSEFRAVGINRLSIGVQSFHDDLLQCLGRIHGRREAIRAAEAAHAAGFDNFNLDLMFGLPGQSLDQGAEDIATAIALEPTHVSYYQLTLEPNTAFHHRPPTLPHEEAIEAIQQLGQTRLAAAGYAQYEVSAYARAGRQCRHNLNYWHFGDYLGIGAGAHGKLTQAAEGRIERLWKRRHPRDYLEAGDKVDGRSVLGRSDAAFEFMLNALRLVEGFDTELFTRHTGLALNVVTPGLLQAERRGLIVWDRERVCPTAQGRNFLNDLIQLFLDDDE